MTYLGSGIGWASSRCPKNIEYDDTQWDDDDWENEICHHCNGDGWGIVGVDWDSDDYINGPYNGEIERCPYCHGSGKAKDVMVW